MVLDVPLLYETGGERLVDAVAVVSARAMVQAQRVLRRPGMSAERLAAILRRQLPDASKRRRADFVIRTDLDHRRAKVQIAAVIDAAGTRPARAWPHRWPLMASDDGLHIVTRSASSIDSQVATYHIDREHAELAVRAR